MDAPTIPAPTITMRSRGILTIGSTTARKRFYAMVTLCDVSRSSLQPGGDSNGLRLDLLDGVNRRSQYDFRHHAACRLGLGTALDLLVGGHSAGRRLVVHHPHHAAANEARLMIWRTDPSDGSIASQDYLPTGHLLSIGFAGSAEISRAAQWWYE